MADLPPVLQSKKIMNELFERSDRSRQLRAAEFVRTDQGFLIRRARKAIDGTETGRWNSVTRRISEHADAARYSAASGIAT
jgi:hypothetical protein